MTVWSDFANWLVHSPWAIVAFLVAGFVLLFHEMLTPLTWGWTGTLGTIAVGAVFAAEWTVGAGGWPGIVSMLVGLTLLLLEIHVWPGRGICAIFGLILLFAGMVQVLGAIERPAFALSVSTAVSLASMVAFFAYLPKSPRWRAIGQEILGGRDAALIPAHSPVAAGSVGTTTTALRPVGTATFDGVPYRALTEGEFLPVGTVVSVQRCDTDHVVVTALATPSDSAPRTVSSS